VSNVGLNKLREKLRSNSPSRASSLGQVHLAGAFSLPEVQLTDAWRAGEMFGAQKLLPLDNTIMSLDLFMNDTCPRCRKQITLTAVELHPISRELAVHKFGCANCGHVTTKILYRKPSITAN
jgi:hypothetical protein